VRRLPPLAALLAASSLLGGCAAQSPTLPEPKAATTLDPGAPADPVGNIARGPYLQHADGGIAVVWYAEQPQGLLRWSADDGHRGEATSIVEGDRHEAVIPGLRAGTRYTYRISSGRGPLAGVAGRMDYSFRAPEPDVLRFVLFGDSGVGPPTQQAVADAIAREPVQPDLVMIAGDVMQPPGDAGAYLPKFFGPYQALLPAIPFYAAVGNHDEEVDGGQPLFDVFTLPRNGPPGLRPESTYFLERAGVQILVHDSNRSAAEIRDHAAPWHREAARRPATFRLAVQHHTMYSSGPNPKPPARSVLAQLYSSTGIDVAFNGHDHFYERTRPVDGVVYVTAGTGGASLYPRAATNGFTAAFANDRHGYCFVEVRGRTLQARQMDSEGRVVDSFSIAKPLAGAAGPPAFSSESEPTTTGQRFHVSDPEAVDAALLRVTTPGGFLVRVNGVQAARQVTPAQGAVTVEVPVSLLQPGENTVDVEDLSPGSAARVELSLLGRR
jgi:hypothetical protein